MATPPCARLIIPALLLALTASVLAQPPQSDITNRPGRGAAQPEPIDLPPKEPNAPAARRDPRWEPDSGRSRANYPPHTLFDYQHLALVIDIPDIETSKFTAVETLTAAPIGAPRSGMTLNCGPALAITAVKVNGAEATYTHDESELDITFPSEVKPGETATILINYTADKPYKNGCGLSWFKTRPGREEQGAMVYSQGEANWNSLWIPCHDFPNDKLTTEITVTVDSAYEVVSNGRLVQKTTGLKSFEGEIDARTGDEIKRIEKPERTRWHWSQDKPHASYLIMLAIGKWDVVDVASAAKPGLALPVYGPVGSAEELKKLYKNTPDMVAYFEQLLDEPYPWDKYAQVIVRNFNWGGMENTSATTLAEYAARGSENSQDDLISHELAHQWTGDLVTCKSWEHIWLNEGWASYMEWMWSEKQHGHDAYLAKARSARRGLISRGLPPAPQGIPMVSNVYTSPDAVFTKAEDPYARGAFVLHMLRERLGDDEFWKGVRLYIDRYKFNSAETDDFRKCLEEASGQSLERFFDQWTKRAGAAVLDVKTRYDESEKKLTVTVKQTQTIDASNPAYGLRLPIYVTFGDAAPTGKWLYVDTDRREAKQTFDVPGKPVQTQVDPHATILARFTTDPEPRDGPPD